jgi:hypothetical protein
MNKIIINLEQEIKAYDIYLNSDVSFHYKRNKNIIDKLITTFYQIQESQNICDDNINIIIEGLSHSWSVVFYYCAGDLTTKFAPYFPVLDTIIQQLSISKKWRIRRNIISITDLIQNNELKNTIIFNGMTDISKNCREFAYHQILNLDRNVAIDFVSNLFKQDFNINTKKDLDELHGFLKNGYKIFRDYGENVVIQNKYRIWQLSKDEFNNMTRDEIANSGKSA